MFGDWCWANKLASGAAATSGEISKENTGYANIQRQRERVSLNSE